MRKLLSTAALAALFVSTSALAAPANVSALQGTITYKNSAATALNIIRPSRASPARSSMIRRPAPTRFAIPAIRR